MAVQIQGKDVSLGQWGVARASPLSDANPGNLYRLGVGDRTDIYDFGFVFQTWIELDERGIEIEPCGGDGADAPVTTGGADRTEPVRGLTYAHVGGDVALDLLRAGDRDQGAAGVAMTPGIGSQPGDWWESCTALATADPWEPLWRFCGRTAFGSLGQVFGTNGVPIRSWEHWWI